MRCSLQKITKNRSVGNKRGEVLIKIKLQFIGFVLLQALAACADNSEIGAFSYGNGALLKYRQSGIQNISAPVPEGIKAITGTIRSVKNKVVYLETDQFVESKWLVICVAITNYPAPQSLMSDHKLTTVGKRVGVLSDGSGNQFELYEYFDLQGYRREFDGKQKAADLELASKRKEQERIAVDKSKAAALKSNQEAADKGDAYGLLRMGERYRDGDGVDKDVVKARLYLEKAAAAGSITANEQLSKLEPK